MHFNYNPYPGFENVTSDGKNEDENGLRDFAAEFSKDNNIPTRLFKHKFDTTIKEDWLYFLDSPIVVGIGGGGNFMSLFQPLNGALYTTTWTFAEVHLYASLPNVKTFWWSNLPQSSGGRAIPNWEIRETMTWEKMKKELATVVKHARESMPKRCPSIKLVS